MKVPTNLVKDAVRYYSSKLSALYPEHEALQMMFWLLEDFFEHTRKDISLNPDIRLSESELLQLHFAVKELLQHKPLQYVTGKAWFYNRFFTVNEAVLIPRPETEILVQEVVSFAEKLDNGKVLDIGTGSACIAISLALECPQWDITAMDISIDALEVAKKNASIHGVNIRFLEADILQNENMDSLTKYDVIVSNPPYVRMMEKREMRLNVLNWEPHEALFVPDEDPLLFYKAIAAFAKRSLHQGGFLALEINEQLSDETVALLHDFDFQDLLVHFDIHQKKRLLTARS